MPKVRRGGRRLGGAEARRRDRVRGVDPRRAPPGARLRRAPRRQACRRRRRRADADAGGDPPRQPRAQALEPRQALLARRGDNEGRPARLLPRRRSRPRPAPAQPPVHDEALSRRLAGQVLLPEGRAEAHAGLDQASAVPRLDAGGGAADHRLRARQRRPRAAVDGQHGLYRHERLDVASRPFRQARLDHVRSRPVRGRGFRGGRRGGAAREADARPRGARELSEDERLPRHPRPRPHRAPPGLRRRAVVCRDRRGRACADASRARDDRVDEEQAPRRPRGRKPERPGEDDGGGLLGPAACRAHPSRRHWRGTR